MAEVAGSNPASRTNGSITKVPQMVLGVQLGSSPCISPKLITKFK
jgi:hypothetical protein